MAKQDVEIFTMGGFLNTNLSANVVQRLGQVTLENDPTERMTDRASKREYDDKQTENFTP